MNKRLGMLILSGLFAIIGLIIAGWMAFGPDEIRLTQGQIQEIIDKQLPFERNDLVVSNAKVTFENNELVVNLDVAGERLGQAFSLSAMVSGEPIYRNGSFYFIPRNVEFKDVIVGDKDGKSLAERMRGAVGRYLPNNEGAQNLITDIAPSIKNWLYDRTMRTTETILSRIPVYTLPNDAKGIAAKAVLGQVLVEEGELIITFTLWRLTWWVLTAIAAFIAGIGMVTVILRNPGLFIGATLLSGDV